jgi:hypothetical protein
VGLALGFELVAQRGDGLIFCGYERGAVRLRLVGSLVVARLAASRHLVGR